MGLSAHQVLPNIIFFQLITTDKWINILQIFCMEAGLDWQNEIGFSQFMEKYLIGSIPNFHHLYIYKSYNFSQNMEALTAK